MKLSIIIPVYNEEKTIEEVIENIVNIPLPKVEKEIIVVDDGSTDETSSKLKAQSSKLKKIIIITHEKNQGKGAAVRKGIEKATGEYILIQDADLEYNPKYIPLLLEPILQGKVNVVYGTRLRRLPDLSKDEKTPLFLIHYFGNRMLSLLTSILYGQWITDMETGYKLFPRIAIENMPLHAKSFEFEPEITAKLLKIGYTIMEVTIRTRPRGYAEGKKLHALRDGFTALQTLVKYRFTN